MVDHVTGQLKKWSGGFGKEYTERNPLTIQDMENSYKRKYGITRTNINEEFLSNIDKDTKILEVGCNVGNQLVLLKEMGFRNLHGIEIAAYAFEIAKRRVESEGISFVKGSAFNIPFKDEFFDMVFTSGVLIHISPDDIKKAVSEIHRCAKKYIWGLDYYAESYQEIVYRGQKDLLWKTDFAKIYTEKFPNLKLVKEERYVYLDQNGHIDQMFLLKK